jgi:hypothetical protein
VHVHYSTFISPKTALIPIPSDVCDSSDILERKPQSISNL